MVNYEVNGKFVVKKSTNWTGGCSGRQFTFTHYTFNPEARDASDHLSMLRSATSMVDMDLGTTVQLILVSQSPTNKRVYPPSAPTIIKFYKLCAVSAKLWLY